MKTLALLAVVLCSSAFAQDLPAPGTIITPADPQLPAVGHPTAPPVDAPVAEAAPLVLLPDGSLAKGRAMKIAAGMTAPFAGHLLDDQEHTRREQINERNAGELADYKAPGNITLSKAQLIAIVAGAVVAGAAAATGIVLAVEKRPGQP